MRDAHGGSGDNGSGGGTAAAAGEERVLAVGQVVVHGWSHAVDHTQSDFNNLAGRLTSVATAG